MRSEQQHSTAGKHHPATLLHDYSISGWVVGTTLKAYRVTARNILAEIERLGLPDSADVYGIMAEGLRYSYQDFDVLSAAMCAIERAVPGAWTRIGTEVR